MTMKNINELVANYGAYECQPLEHKKTITLTERDSQVVNSVMERLQTIFPAWKVAYPTERAWKLAKQEWTKALAESGCVTEQMLSTGFNNARKSEIPFFPSPGQFISWCQPIPENYGLPSKETALNEVIRHLPPGHAIVLVAAKQTKFERSTLDADAYAKVFYRAYEILFRKLMNGEQIETVQRGISDKSNEKPTLSHEQCFEIGKSKVSGLRELFKRNVTQIKESKRE